MPMHISNPSFKQSLLNQVKIKTQNTTHTTATTTAKVANPSHQIDKKTLIGGIVALILAITAIIKRKNISKFFRKTKTGLKNIPQKVNKEPIAKNTIDKTDKIEKIKISLPKPNFTCGEENPIQFAKEKRAYIDSIWNDFIHIDEPFVKANKEKNLLGLKALNQYGTVDDLKRMSDHYRLSEDSDIMEQYAKFVGKVADEYFDVYFIEAHVDRNKDIYNDKAMEEILKTVKKYCVDTAPKGHWINTGWAHYKNFEYYSKKDNKVISENAKAIMHRILEDNPWLQKIVSEQK